MLPVYLYKVGMEDSIHNGIHVSSSKSFPGMPPWLSNLPYHKMAPTEPSKTHSQGFGYRVGLKMHISKKFPSDADAAGQGTKLQVPLVWWTRKACKQTKYNMITGMR
jgi:hypothetical protein